MPTCVWALLRDEPPRLQPGPRTRPLVSGRRVPEPAAMSLDREQWWQQLNLSNFGNSYYQYRDLGLCGESKSILIVGPGQGLGPQVLRWRGCIVSTLDIDATV